MSPLLKLRVYGEIEIAYFIGVVVNFHSMSTAGSVYLYVISHHPEELVDKFLLEESSKKLTHQRRIANEHNFIQ